MLKLGTKIGPYTLVKQLGRGSFGIVWLAERKSRIVTTKVAIKFILEDEPNLEVLGKEAALWAEVSGHPNILPIIEAEIYDGQVVIISEYAPDGSLHEWLKDYQKRNGNALLPVELALKLTLGILEGLEHLHLKKIIHRDLKPQNILLQGQTPRLADFGLARVLKTSAHSAGISGTPAYMAPEAFNGERSEQSDLWSVGIIFYQLLTGTRPFPQEEMMPLMYAICNNQPQPLPDFIPSALQNIILQVLQKDITKRFKSAQELKLALESYRNSLIAINIAPKPKIIEVKAEIGPYKLIKKLGKGNFGEVWLANSKSNKEVAVKIILESGQDLEAIRKEAQIWLDIGKHPNIVSIIDSNIYDNIPVIVSDYVPDGTLQEWLENWIIKNNGVTPSIEKVISMTDGILAGLEHLHSRKIVHRDLKPANILLRGETPCLADFGISRVIKTNPSTHGIAGTPLYMAPETFMGDTRTQSADLWAVGIIFYQLLTTKLPFYDKKIELLIVSIVSKEFSPLPSNIPIGIKNIITKVLEKYPEKRYQSASQMRLAIKDANIELPEEAKTLIIDSPVKAPLTDDINSSLDKKGFLHVIKR